MKDTTNINLEKLTDLLSKLAEQSESVYWLSSPDFKKISYISPAYEKIWGRSREVLYTNPELWITYLHPDDAKDYHPIHHMAEKIKKLGEAARYDEQYRIIRPTGEIRWIIDRGFPVYDNLGNCCGVTGVAIDISEQKEVELKLKEAKEKAEAANELKSQFIQNMQHDMRTPTAGLFHIFDHIKNAKTKEEFLELLELGKNASTELLALCDTLVDFEKIYSGNKPLINEKLSVKDLVKSVCNLNIAAIKSKHLNLLLEIDENIPEYLKGDDFRLQKILTNLIGNSIKFTQAGEIRITAKLISLRKNKVIIEFGVHDTGMGIPEDKVELIFEKFIRLNPSNQGIYKGSGLGLSIVKKCVEELEGEIDVESELGKGTSFYVTIPFEKTLSNRPIRKPAPFELDVINPPLRHNKDEIFDIANTVTVQATSSQRPKGKAQLSVLLIEDHPLALLGAKSALQKVNFVVTTSENVAQAKAQLDAQVFDVVISDIGLPDGDGFQIVMHVKSNPNHINIATPFIALTAHKGEEIKKKATAVGFAYLLNKPITDKEVQTIFNLYTKEKEEPVVETELEFQNQPVLDLEFSRKYSLNKKSKKEEIAEMLEMLEALIRTTEIELQHLKKAVKNEDSKSAREILHKIESGLAYCGVPRFTHAIEYLHEQVKITEETSIWEQSFKNVMIEWDNIIKAYKELKSNTF